MLAPTIVPTPADSREGIARRTVAILLILALCLTLVSVFAGPAVANVIPDCGPANDGERIDVGGNEFECTGVDPGTGPFVWMWLPV